MKRALSFFAFFLMIGSLLPALPVQAQPAAAAFSTKTLQLAWFYKPPADGNLQTLAQNFDTYILTRKDEAARDELKRLGVTAPFLQYYLSNAIHNPGPDNCSASAYGNTVADQPGDFCMIRDQHPDWFLRDSHQNIIQKWSGSQLVAFMDPANPGWQQFFIQRVLARQQTYGWDGLFLDNVDGGLERFTRMEVQLAQYPSAESYQAAVLSFLTAVRQGYGQVTGRPMFANLTSMDDPSVWFSYMQQLDGGMDEGWAVDWHTGYHSVGTWEENLSRIEKMQELNKRAILVSQTDIPSDLKRQRFAFASYLLVNNGGVSFRYADADHYDQALYYETYQAQLGTPLGPRYASGPDLWKRDFSGGSVTVNPTTHDATITIYNGKVYPAATSEFLVCLPVIVR